MQLPDFLAFDGFNQLRKKMSTDKLGYFELFDPKLHLTGCERSQLEYGGLTLPVSELNALADQTLCYKNSRVLAYNPDFSYYRTHGEYPTYHVAICAKVRAKSARAKLMVTTKINIEYPFHKTFKKDQNEETASYFHGLVVCKHCLHSISYKDYDEVRNRKRGYSQRILSEFSLHEFFQEYPQYPIRLNHS